MADETDKGALRKLPEESRYYRWLLPPPTYCDHYTAQGFSNGIVRISFGEYVTKEHEPIYRLSVAMPLSDVRLLHRTLGRVIKEYDEEEREKETAAKGSSAG